MKRKNPFLLCSLLLMLTVPTWAHHNFDARYNASKAVNLTGQVTGVGWTNPHVFIFLVIPDTDGKIREWHVEGGSPHQLEQLGWSLQKLNDMIKAKITIVASGFESKGNVPGGFR